MQPLQCDLKAQIPKTPYNYQAQAHPKQLEATLTMRQKKKANRPQPPLYTEKHKVSCSGFLPKTEPLQHHTAIPMRSAGSLDVRDAFLQVEQDDPVLVYLKGVIKCNLPGQRLEAKQWFLCLKAFLTEQLGFTFCQEQPFLARTPGATIMTHVDDILFVGLRSFGMMCF